jgi:hypothetical protein
MFWIIGAIGLNCPIFLKRGLCERFQAVSFVLQRRRGCCPLLRTRRNCLCRRQDQRIPDQAEVDPRQPAAAKVGVCRADQSEDAHRRPGQGWFSHRRPDQGGLDHWHADSGSTIKGVSAASLATVQYVASTVALPKGQPTGTAAVAPCPAGQKVIGGGATVSNSVVAFINEGAPTADRSGWFANGYSGGDGVSMTVTAICTPVTAATG